MDPRLYPDAMKTFWEVVGEGTSIRMEGTNLPIQIEDIRSYVKSMDGAVPIEPYPSSIAYDETKPETIFAAAFAYVQQKTGTEAFTRSYGVYMPRDTNPIGPNVVH
jgi:hypothetical protein